MLTRSQYVQPNHCHISGPYQRLLMCCPSFVSLLPCQTRLCGCSSTYGVPGIVFKSPELRSLSALQLRSKGRSSLPSSVLPRFLPLPFVLRPLCLASSFLPCLISSALPRFLPPFLRPPRASSHLPSRFGSKCKSSGWYQICHFHLMLSVRCPLVSYAVCQPQPRKNRTMNYQRKYFHSISVCTCGSLSHITTLSTIIIVDVQLNLATTNAEFKTHRVRSSINTVLDFRMYMRIIVTCHDENVHPPTTIAINKIN